MFGTPEGTGPRDAATAAFALARAIFRIACIITRVVRPPLNSELADAGWGRDDSGGGAGGFKSVWKVVRKPKSKIGSGVRVRGFSKFCIERCVKLAYGCGKWGLN